MIGGIAGDIVGSPYEGRAAPAAGFPLFAPESVFTDDTVCLLAIADAVMGENDYAASLRRYVRFYPDAGYGKAFKAWALSDREGPYGSNGNGAAMRVAPIGWAAATAEEALLEAERSARVSHDHPDAVAAARAVAFSIWEARQAKSGTAIADLLERRLGYRLSRPARAAPGNDASAAGTVPLALACALKAANWEDAVRRAVMLGGDTDTIASIAGAVAEAIHGVPLAIATAARTHLPRDLAHIADTFDKWMLRTHGPLGGLWARLIGLH